MENLNSTGQEKKVFFQTNKGKKVIIICIAAFLLFGFTARGLGMRSVMAWGHRDLANRNQHFMGLMERVHGGSGISAATIKDFESLGIVFAESTAARKNGFGLTYEALMREAAQMGADAIINVNISPTSGFFNRTWSGSALAIKYMN
jgi:hypothetical protein